MEALEESCAHCSEVSRAVPTGKWQWVTAPWVHRVEPPCHGEEKTWNKCRMERRFCHLLLVAPERLRYAC